MRALELMEMQRHAQLMYTSCGWFFDDISGIETVQIIAYAARVLQLARQLFGEQAAALEPAFLARLAEAHSNDASGRRRRRRSTRRASAPWSSAWSRWLPTTPSARVFSSFAEETDLFCYPRAAHLLRHLYLGPRAAGAGPGAHRQRHHRARSRAFRLRCFTSATRILPRR